MASRRWICPLCESGCLGPERPRRADVRRYCLDCSAKTGRLVERTCPAVENARAARQERRAAHTNRKRDRERAAELDRRSAGGVDLLAEAKRFARLPALRRLTTFPEFVWRRSPSKPLSSGHCYYYGGTNGEHRIVVTSGTDPYSPRATLIHEIVHAALPAAGHSAEFWSVVRRAAREAWPTARFDFANARDGWQVQRAIRNGLRGLAEGPS